jgi:ketosteroid isomerase-like protein
MAVLLSMILIASCGSAPTPDPISIVQGSNDRLNQDDLDGFMEFFAEDAVIIDPHGTYVGSAAIRDYIEKEVVPQNYRFELSNFNSTGNDVTYTYMVYINNVLRDTNEDGLDVVVDGKIIFEGTGKMRHFFCLTDPSQAFCPVEE